MSRRLSEPEVRIGSKLVERTTRRFKPTAFGREYHARAREILASLDRLGSGDQPIRSTPVKIAISVADRTDAWQLAPRVAAFQLDDAEVEIDVRVDGGDADLLISAVPGPGAQAVGGYRLLPCAAPS